MSKTVKILIALVVALAVATPAMSAFKLNGYYRLQGDATSLNRAENTESDTATMFDNRLRLKMNYGVNDYINVVYYMEVDTPWGEASKGSIGGGGKVGADGVNVETKNAYVDFKLPDTSWKVRTGIQGGGIGGNFESLVEDDDMAGIKAMGKLGGANVTLLYSKWNEGEKDSINSKDQLTVTDILVDADLNDVDVKLLQTSDRTHWDDTDYYAVDVNTMVSEQFKLGGSVAYIDDNSVEVDDIYAGIYANYKMDNMDFGGFFLYRDYSNDTKNKLIDKGNAMALDLNGKMALDNGYVKLHFAYFNDDDKSDEMNTFSAAKGGFEYHKDNLMLFLTDVYYNNAGHTAVALSDAAYAGYGLMFLTVSGKVDLPQDYYLRYGAGYFSALEDERNDEATASREDTDLGAEFAARIGKVFAEKYDVSLRGAYGMLGGFYDATTAGADDPDDIYKVVGMVNVSF